MQKLIFAMWPVTLAGELINAPWWPLVLRWALLFGAPRRRTRGRNAFPGSHGQSWSFRREAQLIEPPRLARRCDWSTSRLWRSARTGFMGLGLQTGGDAAPTSFNICAYVDRFIRPSPVDGLYFKPGAFSGAGSQPIWKAVPWAGRLHAAAGSICSGRQFV
jgi:hypothetical protein